MTLYADDPDVHVVYALTDSAGDLDFTPVVQVKGHDDITASWVGDPGPARSLRVPLAGLPSGIHTLRLVVPGDNDVHLGAVILS